MPVSTDPQPIQQKLNKGRRDKPRSRVPNQKYRDNWEKIFGQSKESR